MDLESKARAAAEAALIERDWEPKSWDPWAGAMDGDAPGGSYSIRAYPADGVGAPRDGLCRVDDWTRRDHSGDISPSLWVLGIPRPEEVPALFEGHPEVTTWSDVGELGNEVLDLLTGEVIPERRAQELLEDPVLKMIHEAKGRLGGYEQAARALDTVGWRVREIRLGLDGVPDTIIAKRR